VIEVDIIILSYAKTKELKEITQQAIVTCLSSENPENISFNILVIESDRSIPPYQFERTTTIYPEVSFGFNKFLNIGILQTSAKYLCLCNNDLIFHKNWASEILEEFARYPNLLSANPYCDRFDYDRRIVDHANVVFKKDNMSINGVLTGWCIFVERTVLNQIGPLDERFEFWYADNDYDLTLQKHKIEHALIKSSKVTHLACQSHSTLGKKLDEMTIGQRKIFDKKWNKRSIWKRLYSKISKAK